MADQALELVIRARDQSNAAFNALLSNLKKTQEQEDKTSKSTEEWSKTQQRAAMRMEAMHEAALKMNTSFKSASDDTQRAADTLRAFDQATGGAISGTQGLAQTLDLANVGWKNLNTTAAGFNAQSAGVVGAGLAIGTAIGSWLNTFPAVQRAVDGLRDSLIEMLGQGLIQTGDEKMKEALAGIGDFQARMAKSNEEAVARQIEGLKKLGLSEKEIAERYSRQAPVVRTAIDRFKEEAAAHEKAAEAAKKHAAALAAEGTETRKQLEANRAAEEKFIAEMKAKGDAALDAIAASQKRIIDRVKLGIREEIEARIKALEDQRAMERKVFEDAEGDFEEQARRQREVQLQRLNDIDALGRALAQLGGEVGGLVGAFLQMGDGLGLLFDNLDRAAQGTIKDTQKAEAIVQGLAGILSQQHGGAKGAMGGAMAGAGAGAAFGPWGAAIGGLLGGIGGAVFGGQNEHKRVNDLRDEFVKAQGGLDALNKKAHEAGLTLDALLNAKKVEDYNSAMKNLTDTLDLQKEAEDKTLAAMQEFGITIDQMGPRFAQQQLDKQAATLFEKWELLKTAGASYDTLVAGMGPKLNEYVQTAVKAGATIPESFRPVIEQMIQHGELLDENGNAYKSTEEAGITFAQSMTEAMTSAAKATERLVELLERMLGLSGREVTLPVNFPVNGGGEPGGRFDRGEGMAAGDRTITGWGIPAVLHGTPGNPEFVQRGDQIRDHLRAVIAESGGYNARGGQPLVVHNHIMVGTREVARQVQQYADMGKTRSKTPLRRMRQ